MPRPKQPQNSTLEKLIVVISPQKALQRQQARLQMSMISAYNSGSKNNDIFKTVNSMLTSADSSVLFDRETLVNRSRDSIRNVPIASAIVKRICDHSVGHSGLTLHSQIDRKFLGISEDKALDIQSQLEGFWKTWEESEESDYHREINFKEKTYLTLRSELEGGDCFSLLLNMKRPGSVFDLKIQTLEGEHCSNRNGQTNSDTLTDGFEKNSSGVNARNWFSKYHPGDLYKIGGNEWVSREIFNSSGRRNVLHHFDKIRPGQTRGIPVLGPVTAKLLQLGKASDAELTATMINAMYAMLVKGSSKDTVQKVVSPGSTTKSNRNEKIEINPGTIVEVPENVEKFESFDPKRPNVNFWQFFKSIVTEIGASVGVPRSMILMEFDKSYSASRGEVLLAWAYFLAKRSHIAVNLVQPVYEALIDEAVAKNMISAPGYFLSPLTRRAYLGSPYTQWTGPIKPAINELQEANALRVYNEMGVQSKKEITAKTTGRDWNAVNNEIQLEKELTIMKEIERQERLRKSMGEAA